jgi:Ca2+-binding RTX toxin-like protein
MLKGGQGNDLSDGGEGDDIIIGNQGDDYLVSGAGNDVIRVCLQLLLQNWRYNQK